MSTARHSRTGWLKLLGCFAAIIVGSIALFVLSVNSGHRRPPTPSGLVFRVEARRVLDPLDRFEVFPVNNNGPAVVVFDADRYGVPADLRVFRYPDGSLLDELSGQRASQFRETLGGSSNGSNPGFDFDADGVQDRVETGEASKYGVTRVRSGADGRVLFEDDDPLEYECSDRGIALGDLDGDGFAELALLHPRMDRTYDMDPGDWLYGAKSWITIVSGSRVER